MKTVFNNRQLAHIWANQSQSNGRNSSNTLYFRDTEIYSYGNHYLMGKIYTINSRKFALINGYNYSPTTCKQRSNVTSALSGLIKYFYVDYPNDIKKSLKQIENELIEQYFDYFTKLKFDQWHIDLYKDSINDYNTLCEMSNNPKNKFILTDEMLDLLNEHAEIRKKREQELNTPEMLEKRKVEKEKQELRQQQKLKEKLANDIVKFRNFEINNINQLKPQILRVKDDIVQTSGGAEVPLSHAKRLLMAVNNGLNVINKRIGHFTVNELSNETIKIGCHLIELTEARQVLNTGE